jgi:polysaccharide pyruvyl transferase WcaK-like protein
MNFVVIADLNDLANFHVGDEAMFEANLNRLRNLFPAANFTVLSQSPAFTARHYNVRALPYFGFSPKPGESAPRKALLQTILEQAKITGKSEAETERIIPGPCQALFESLKNCDALIVSGGGNISSTWPHHLYERVALIKIAALYGKPAIITGQTFGPNFTPEDRALLKETLPLARLIGVREKASFEICRELGLPASKILYQLDDAAFLKPFSPQAKADPALAKLLATAKPWLAVTIHHFTDFETAPGQRRLQALAGQILKICHETGAHPVFLSHAAVTPGFDTWPDEAVGQRLARLLEPAIEMPVIGVRPTGEVAYLTGQAALVISTRYHPLVFGLAAGVPALGIYVDHYTEIKLRGALEHARLGDWLIPLELAYTELFSGLAVELWRQRPAITRHLATIRPHWQETEQTRWLELKAALTGAPETFAATFDETEPEPSYIPAFENLEEKGGLSIKPRPFLARLIAELAGENKTNAALVGKMISEKDRYIASLLQEITTLRRMQIEKDIYNKDLLKTLERKDATIRNQLEILAPKDAYIKSLQEALADKDTYIFSLRDALKQKDIYIESLQEGLADKEANNKKLFNPA